jgi:Zn-dependent protease
MTRERIVIGAIVVALIVLAVAKQVITSETWVYLIVVIPSIILHEISHGVAALWAGDDTAKKAGRLTLNPVPHIDILGTLIIPAALAIAGLPVFGYAKPVPVDPSRMRHPRNDTVLVSLAGPATNIVIAVAAAFWLRQEHGLSLTGGPWAQRIPLALGLVNVILAAFNLLPIPPLDGSSVVERVLPKDWQQTYNKIRPYGMLVLMGLVLLDGSFLAQHVFIPVENLWLRLVQQ